MTCLDSPGKLKTVFAGQADVHKDQIRQKSLDFLQGLGCTRSFLDKHKGESLIQSTSKGLAKGSAVIND